MERRNSQLAELWRLYIGDAYGIIFIDFLEKEKAINSDYYIALLERLQDEIVERRPHLNKKKVLFHKDNAPCHQSMKTMEKLYEFGFELLPHPPYFPELAPSDFYLFSNLQIMQIIAEIESYFEPKDKYWTTKILSKSLKIAIIGVSPSMATMLNNKLDFCQKI